MKILQHKNFQIYGMSENCLPPAPNRNILDDSCLLKSLLVYTPCQSSQGISARVGWLNIGPVAAGPAGPAPMALE